ncbi:MAG TPA: hypothetical protein VMF03_14095 [Steroidobacteraceae bacterium]|nr:hypothetical protein [Steroidobacteraceae bacterium]
MAKRPMLLGSAMLVALLCAAGCSTVSKWKQEHRAASLHREEEEEAAAAHAEPPAYQDMKRRMAQQDARLRKLQATLAQRSDPDSLAGAALLERAILGYSSPTAQQLAARAVAGAPTRADLAFVQLQLCETAPQCDPVSLETQQLALDPENGVVWVYVLRRADLAKDRSAEGTAFYNLARSRRIDLYWNRIVSHLAAASAGSAGFDAGAALTQVISIESTFALDYDPITRLCLQPPLQAEMLEPCRQIAAAFRQGDTAVVEAYGSSLALNLWPANSPERLAVIAERRRLRYRVELMDRNRARLNSAQATRALAGLVGHYASEQAAYHALYLRLGLNPDPPSNWKDPAPGG